MLSIQAERYMVSTAIQEAVDKREIWWSDGRMLWFFLEGKRHPLGKPPASRRVDLARLSVKQVGQLLTAVKAYRRPKEYAKLANSNPPPLGEHEAVHQRRHIIKF